MIQETNQTLKGFLKERERLNDIKDGLTRVRLIDGILVVEWR